MKVYALYHSGEMLGIYSSPELAKQKIESEAIYPYDKKPEFRWDVPSCYGIVSIIIDEEKERFWHVVYSESREQWSIYKDTDDYMTKTYREKVLRIDDKGFILYLTYLSHHSRGEALRIGKKRIREYRQYSK